MARAPRGGQAPYLGTAAAFAKEHWPLFLATAMEGCEFALYASLEPWLALNFFPDSPALGWVAFGAAFALEPLGGLAFGAVGDHHGRRPAVLLSLYLMCGATLAQGLTPALPTLGPAWLLTMRCVQGLALGGEESSCAVFLAEAAPPRVLAASGLIVFAGSQLGFLASTGLVMLLSRVLTGEQMLAWGWRLPFLLTAVPSGITLYHAHALEETAQFEESRRAGEPPPMLALCRAAVADHWRSGLLVIAGTASVSAQSYLLGAYLKAWLTKWTAMGMDRAFAIVFASQAVVLAASLPFTVLADHAGLGTVMLFSGATAATLTVPMYAILYHFPSTDWAAWAAILVPAAIDGAALAMFPWVAELFPVGIRGTAVALYMNVANAAGGVAPAVCDLLPNALGVGYYSVVLGLVQMAAVAVCLHLHQEYHRTKTGLQVAHLRAEPY